MKRFVQEPLLHFLLLGIGLFVLFNATSESTSNEPKSIIVTQARIKSLTTAFTDAWGRPPSKTELQKLIDDYIQEEVCCREAMAMGFDRDDSIIRNQLVKKLEVVPNEMAAQTQPTDEELRAFLHQHPDLFSTDRHYSFRQVFLNPKYHHDRLQADAATLLAKLNEAGTNVDLRRVGDPYALDHTFEDISSADVVKKFGESFAIKLGNVAVGRWQGLIASEHGEHLVLVTERHEGHLPSLDSVRDHVREEWAFAKRREVRAQFYESLRKQYAIVVEQPKPDSRSETPMAEAK